MEAPAGVPGNLPSKTEDETAIDVMVSEAAPCDDGSVYPTETKSLSKRTVALHVGYVGTAYKGKLYLSLVFRLCMHACMLTYRQEDGGGGVLADSPPSSP